MLQKLLNHLVASQLTQSVMSALAQPTDPMARQILACQIQVNFFEWLKNLLVDPAWPTPAIDASWLSAAIAAAFAGTQPPAPSPAPANPPAPASVLPGALGSILGGISPPAGAGKDSPGVGDMLRGLAHPEHLARMLRISPANPGGL